MKQDEIYFPQDENDHLTTQQYWQYHKAKTEGANIGGIYKSTNNPNQQAMFKQIADGNEAEAVAEFISGLLHKSMGVPAVEYFFVKDQNIKLYSGSIMLQNARDLYKAINHKVRPKALSKADVEKIINISDEPAMEDLRMIFASSLLQGDFDIHTGNIMEVNNDGKRRYFKIDHGWSLYKLSDNVGIFNVSSHLNPFKPRNHYLEYAKNKRKIFISEQFADCLDNIAENFSSEENLKKIHAKVYEGLKKVQKKFNTQPNILGNFAERVGIEGDNPMVITSNLISKLKIRANSLQELSMQIRMDLCIKTNEKGNCYIDTKALMDLMEQKPQFFKDKLLEESKNKFRFRDPEHKYFSKELNMLLEDTIRRTYNSEKIEDKIEIKVYSPAAKVFEQVYDSFLKLVHLIVKTFHGNSKPAKEQEKKEIHKLQQQFIDETNRLSPSYLIPYEKNINNCENKKIKKILVYKDKEGNKLALKVSEDNKINIAPNQNTKFNGYIMLPRLKHGKALACNDIVIIKEGYIIGTMNGQHGVSQIKTNKGNSLFKKDVTFKRDRNTNNYPR